MADKIHEYKNTDVTVQYNVKRCIHAAECVRGLNKVFDSDKRPWVQPENGSAEEIARVIERCPSGALHYLRTDGGAPERVPDKNTVRLSANGPLYVHGDVEIISASGSSILHDTRIALCRCGASRNKPFCDNSHKDIRFQAPAAVTEDKINLTGAAPEGHQQLSITPTFNGPLAVQGWFEIVDEHDKPVFRGSKTWLCRCGGSKNKPFCDSTHKSNGFSAE